MPVGEQTRQLYLQSFGMDIAGWTQEGADALSERVAQFYLEPFESEGSTLMRRFRAGREAQAWLDAAKGRSSESIAAEHYAGAQWRAAHDIDVATKIIAGRNRDYYDGALLDALFGELLEDITTDDPVPASYVATAVSDAAEELAPPDGFSAAIEQDVLQLHNLPDTERSDADRSEVPANVVLLSGLAIHGVNTTTERDPATVRTTADGAVIVTTQVLGQYRPPVSLLVGGAIASHIDELFEIENEDEGDELSWQDQALCAQTDPELFFPERGGSTREAKRICRNCEARAKCLEYALEHDEQFGIWGGMSERDRRRLKRQSI